MAFKEISITDIPKQRRAGKKQHPLSQDVSDFMRSSAYACELDLAKYENVKSAISTVRQYVYRKRFNCRVMVRDNRMFLVKY